MNETMLEKLERQAAGNPQKIAFPESLNDMILKAAAEVVARGIGYPLLIGNPSEIEAAAAAAGAPVDGFSFFDNMDEDAVGRLAADYAALFGDLSEKSVRRKAKDPIQCAMLLLKLGRVDGVAAGRECTTADVIIAAQAIVGLKEGMSTISALGIVDAPRL